MKVKKEFTRELYDKLIKNERCQQKGLWIPPYEVLWLCHKRIMTKLVLERQLTSEAIVENKAIEHMFKGYAYWQNFIFRLTPEKEDFWYKIFSKNDTTEFYEYWPTCPDRIQHLKGVEKFLHQLTILNEHIEKWQNLK